jgi:ribosome recycling factor
MFVGDMMSSFSALGHNEEIRRLRRENDDLKRTDETQRLTEHYMKRIHSVFNHNEGSF